MNWSTIDGCFKAYGDDDDTLGLVLRKPTINVNAGKMSARVVISKEIMDHSRDVVVTKGIDLSQHKKFPAVFFIHKRDMPVGAAEDKLNNYTVKMRGDNELIAETYFTQHTLLGEQSFRLVDSGVMKGASIGFVPKQGMITKGINALGQETRTYGGITLFEYSHIPIPDNPDCIVEAVEKGFGGKPLCSELDNCLRPLCHERPVMVVGGFEKPIEPTAEAVEKAWDSDDHPLASEQRYAPGGVHADILHRLQHGSCHLSDLQNLRPSAQLNPMSPMSHPVHRALKEMVTDGVIDEGKDIGQYPDLRGNNEARQNPRFSIVTAGIAKQKGIADWLVKMLPKQQPQDLVQQDIDDGLDVPTDDDIEQTQQQMKPFAQAMHTLHEWAMQGQGIIEDTAAQSEHTEGVAALSGKVSAMIGKVLGTLKAIYDGYMAEHPEQPPLPEMADLDASPDGLDDENLEDDESEDDWDEDAETSDDDSLDDADNDVDTDNDDDMADDWDDDKAKKKKKAALKAWSAYSVDSHRRYTINKAMEHGVKDLAAVMSAKEFIDSILANPKAGVKIKELASQQAESLDLVIKGLTRNQVIFTSASPKQDDDEWGDVLKELTTTRKVRDELVKTIGDQRKQIFKITGK